MGTSRRLLVRHLYATACVSFCSVAWAASACAEQIDLEGPSGSVSFGASVTVLPNGNIVVTDPDAGNAAPQAGAVHLYSPNGARISTLTGGSTEDRVGGAGVKVLANGHFLILSPDWGSSEGTTTGAVTWVNGDTGLSGVVSPSNSLVGVTADTFGNIDVTLLGNGNYVVASPKWSSGAVANAGAVTWANGETGLSGEISAANSLVGSAQNTCVGGACSLQTGYGGVVASADGNYVVVSPDWSTGAIASVGAVTWVDGSKGLTGAVSAANSLVGSSANDRVGFGVQNVTVLTNGHFVVASPYWANGATKMAGAVTWIDGAVGRAGIVSVSNSLVGFSDGSQVGSNGVVALSNGNYVVQSPDWSNDLGFSLGAATWADGTQGISGLVSAANSLVGKTEADRVGSGVAALSNGNYVVVSPAWNLGDFVGSGNGAVTWVDGRTGLTGEVSASNSLIGGQDEAIGAGGVFALSNGNFVVASPYWGGGGTWPRQPFGAVTWADGTRRLTGLVSPSNSLAGNHPNDRIGQSGLDVRGVTVLANGNYVVQSGYWNDGIGAVTWGDGRVGTTGAVTVDNSLTGMTPICQVTPLANGHFVVANPYWSSATATTVGAVTWGNGNGGLAGTISASNSLLGGFAGDQVGRGGIIALSNGNYVVSSPDWGDGTELSLGAVTWGNGSTGSTGLVSADNSLVGTVRSHGIARGFTQALGDDSYLITSDSWNNGNAVNAGALTLASARFRQTGAVNAYNSVVGTAPAGGVRMRYAYDASRDRLVVGRPADNIVTLFTRDQIFADSFL